MWHKLTRKMCACTWCTAWHSYLRSCLNSPDNWLLFSHVAQPGWVKSGCVYSHMHLAHKRSGEVHTIHVPVRHTGEQIKIKVKHCKTRHGNSKASISRLVRSSQELMPKQVEGTKMMIDNATRSACVLSAGGLPGPAGILLLRGSSVPVQSGSWGGPAGARLHLDPTQPGRGQPRHYSTCQLPCRCDRRDYGPVEEKLAAEGEGGCGHHSQRGWEFQEAVWLYSRGTRWLQQAH